MASFHSKSESFRFDTQFGVDDGIDYHGREVGAVGEAVYEEVEHVV